MTNAATEMAVPRIAADEGEARWWWGNLAVLKVTGEEANGGLAIVELTIGPDRMVPLHVHHREEETFLVTRGHLTFHLGDEAIEADPGDIVVGPRDIPHRFKAGPDGATVLLLLTPAGLEGLIREQSIPATRRELPRPEDLTPPDLERMAQIAVSYGCELLV